ncbi:MAG: hypothetical protein JSW03_00690 [Candidatus Eiseniibacteriota bacterium]|nr:MAG: hypothetical protein JSW03_00690 [Candidatus Eisenbacteria bacterium]
MVCSLRNSVLGAVFVFGMAFLSVTALAGLGTGVEVLESDEAGITLRVQVDSFTVQPAVHEGRTFHLIEVSGFLMTEEEGLPQLPYTAALLGVPFGKEPRLSVVSDETATRSGVVPLPTPRAFIADGEFPTPVREFAIDETFYGGGTVYPSEVAVLARLATLRHQKVVSVNLFPFRYEPAARRLVYSTELIVRVDFVETGEREPERMNLDAAPSFELYSEGLYQGLLINYEQAREWRMKPRSEVKPLELPVSQASNEYKIAIDSAGLYRVSYSDIPGLTGTYPVGQVRLFEKFYVEGDPSPFKETDVPIDVFDSNSNGYFDGSDYFVFYGLSFRNRFPGDAFEARYSFDNVYWLTVDGAAGLSMNERSSWRSDASQQQAQSFVHTDTYEKDVIYMNVPPRENMDYYFWKDATVQEASEPFSVFAPDTTMPWRLRARFQGFLSWTHVVTLIIENNRGQSRTLFDRATFGPSFPSFKAEITLDTGFSIPDTLLASGANTFKFIGEHQIASLYYPMSGAYFDWFEISYYKKYVSQGGKLALSSGQLSGEVEFGLRAFPSQSILLYDVTDSLNVVRLTVDPSQVTLESDGYRLLFRDSVGAAPRRYAAVSGSAVRPVPTVELDVPSSLATSGAGKDYFIVSFDGFVPQLGPLVSQREAQGHSVEVARLSDVFDEFSGGKRSAGAIKKYMKYAFGSWGTPLFLLLVGDASEDYKGLSPYSDPDFMPTYLILSPVVGTSGKELVGSDQWYVTALDGVVDDYPDMYVGRLPVGSSQELSSLVSKIISYETFSPEQSFRGRGLFVADDAYSSTDYANDCFRLGERVFDNISLEAIQLIDESPAVPGFAAETFFLSAYLDTVPSSPKPSCVPLSDMQQYTRTKVTPRLLERLTNGSLFVNYQGHGNRNVLTHEQLFASYFTSPDDVPSVNNYARPSLFMAFACHVGDYDSEREGTSGDGIMEKLLLAQGRGAVGTFSSDAFENLPPNTHGDMNLALFDAFFAYPPNEDLRGKRGARWLLGEIITSAKIRFLAGDYLNKHLVKTYSLLGDPGVRMDALPPRFAVTVNDSSFYSGSYLRASSADDSVRVSAYISDEVAVNESSIWIEEAGSEGRGVIPSAEYTVSVLADTAAGASRKYHVYFPTVLRAASYDMRLHATDVNGRETVFELKSELRVSFTSGGQPIPPGGFVPSTLSLRAVVTSPIILAADDMVLLVDSLPVASSREQIDMIGREWRIDAVVSLSDGEHVLAVQVDGASVRAVTVNVASGFALQGVFCYPSPFDDVTSFNYDLTGSPSSVRIELFTVSGRKIKEIEGTTWVGRNSVVWEGRDAEGHRVANGLYIYKLTATDAGGRKATELGKVVKVE